MPDVERVRLTGRLVLWQRVRGHRTATDDVLCAFAAHAARPRATSVLDLGAGQGAVALMIAGANPAAAVTAVEVQEVSYRLLVRNVEENGLAERVVPMHADLRTVDLHPRRFELVTGSPPYVRPGAGITPRDPQRAGARFELRGGIEAYCRAAARWVSPDGRVVFLMDAAQDDRSRRAAHEAGLAVEERLIVYPRAGAAPRFIVYRMANRPGERESRESFLTIRDERGEWTEDFATVRRALDLPQRDGSAG